MQLPYFPPLKNPIPFGPRLGLRFPFAEKKTSASKKPPARDRSPFPAEIPTERSPTAPAKSLAAAEEIKRTMRITDLSDLFPEGKMTAQFKADRIEATAQLLEMATRATSVLAALTETATLLRRNTDEAAQVDLSGLRPLSYTLMNLAYMKWLGKHLDLPPEVLDKACSVYAERMLGPPTMGNRQMKSAGQSSSSKLTSDGESGKIVRGVTSSKKAPPPIPFNPFGVF